MGPSVNALCMVAHPDDCVIFAMSLITTTSWTWTIGYLTYDESAPRAQEIKKFWQTRKVNTVFLGFEDDWRDIERGSVSFDATQATQAITDLCAPFDIVLTHDSNGDYGHLHHKLVHDSVQHPLTITFAGPGLGNHAVTLNPRPYDLSELPLHAQAIQGFHETQHRNEYHVPQCIMDRVIG